MSFPHILIHDGPYLPYMRWSFLLASRVAPSVCLVSNLDRSYFPNLENGRHFDLETYKGERHRRFCASYAHMSTNPIWFELKCFERWFILREFLERERIEKFSYADTDIFLQEPMDIEKRYGILNPTCWSSIVFSDRQLLVDFTDFLLAVYENKDGEDYLQLLRDWEGYVSRGSDGGICDMVLQMKFWTLLGKQKRRDCIELLSESSINRGKHDHQASSREEWIARGWGFLLEDGFKKILWREGVPYCIFANGTIEKEIRMATFHLQGGLAKSCPERFVSPSLKMEKS